jgi:hypothetical protein
MSISTFLPIVIALIVGLIAGLVVRWLILSDQERRAWGDGRADLPRAQRREIRRCVGQGRPVGDQKLAGAAVRFGEALTASSRSGRLWSDNPPRWVTVFGRIFFPVLGSASVALGVTGRDPVTLISGVVLLGFTVLYLPPTLRRIAAGRAERSRRVLASIDANRRLTA